MANFWLGSVLGNRTGPNGPGLHAPCLALPANRYPLYTIGIIGRESVGGAALINHISSRDFNLRTRRKNDISLTTLSNGAVQILRIRVPDDTTTWFGESSVQRCEAFLLLYDVTSRESFEAVGKHRQFILRARGGGDSEWLIEHFMPPRIPTTPMIVVGTRADKARERQVSTSEGAAFAAQLRAAFKEVVGVNVAEADGVIMDVVDLLHRAKTLRFDSLPKCRNASALSAALVGDSWVHRLFPRWLWSDVRLVPLQNLEWYRKDMVRAQVQSSLTKMAALGNLYYITEALDRNHHLSAGAHASAGGSPLHVAAAAGQVAVISGLLTERPSSPPKRAAPLPDVNGIDPCTGWTALHAAAAAGKLDAVMLLVHNGAEVDARAVLGDTPLEVAAEREQQAVVRFLVEKAGAAVDGRGGGRYGGPLYAAIWAKSDGTVRALVEAGADVERPDRAGRTPLQIAVESKNAAIVRVLMQAGADIEKVDGKGRTLLETAIWMEERETVKLLWERGKGKDADPRDIRASGEWDMSCFGPPCGKRLIDLL